MYLSVGHKERTSLCEKNDGGMGEKKEGIGLKKIQYTVYTDAGTDCKLINIE